MFKAIEEFVENYTKQRDEYIKIVEKIQAIRPQTYNKVKWSEIVEKPLPKRKVSLPTADGSDFEATPSAKDKQERMIERDRANYATRR